MAKLTIVADSTSSLEKKVRDQYSIDYCRMMVAFGAEGEEIPASLDYEEVNFHDYYQKMRDGMRIYTDMVPIQEFEDVFTRHLEAGEDVLYVSCSSALSGSYKASLPIIEELSKKYPERKIAAVDSLGSNASQKYMCIEAAKLAQDGKTFEEVKAWLEENRLKIQDVATVGSLTYLSRAGRVKASKAFFGNLFGVKPLLYSNELGQNIAFDKAKGRKNSIIMLAEKIASTITDPENQEQIYIVHGDCQADAEVLAAKLYELIPGLKHIDISPLDPIVGASCGPETLIVGFYGNMIQFKGE